MSTPAIQYTKCGDTNIAYATIGDRRLDVLVMNFVVSVDAQLESPEYAHLFDRLSAFSRVICFDRSGIGLSDPFTPDNPPTIEQWAQEAIAVLDAAGAKRVAVLADPGAQPTALVLAATHPDRVSHLALMRGPEVPGDPERWIESAAEEVRTGRLLLAGAIMPSLLDDRDAGERLLRASRRSASPATQAALMRINIEIISRGLRPLFASVRAPTLVIWRRDNPAGPSQRLSDAVAEGLLKAQMVEVPGRDLSFWSKENDPIVDVVQEFITGTRPDPLPDDRVFATILFTDIVGSTETLSAKGDRGWRELLDRNDAMARRTLDRFRGRYVNTTGDGIVATFDGPARAVRCAQEITQKADEIGLFLRAGLHAGEVELRGDDVAGIAVHTAQRVSALAGPGEVLVSRTVTDLVAGSGLEFEERGEHELKGVPGKWAIYAVRS